MPHHPGRLRGRIALVLGKPPGASSILPEVAVRLRGEGYHVAVHLPHELPGVVPAWLFDVELVVHRGLHPWALATLRRLEEAGIRCSNPTAGVRVAHDRLLVTRRLAAAGLPTPAVSVAATWAEAVAAARGRAVAVKARDGRRGRGAGVVLAPGGLLPTAPPFDGPYVIQEFVTGAGREVKLYVAGDHVRALRAPDDQTPAAHRGDPLGVSALARLGLRVGHAVGLEIFGVDILTGAGGPSIVDVNPFPGFRRVPHAPRLVADAIGTIARDAGRCPPVPTADR